MSSLEFATIMNSVSVVILCVAYLYHLIRMH